MSILSSNMTGVPSGASRTPSGRSEPETRSRRAPVHRLRLMRYGDLFAERVPWQARSASGRRRHALGDAGLSLLTGTVRLRQMELSSVRLRGAETVDGRTLRMGCRGGTALDGDHARALPDRQSPDPSYARGRTASSTHVLWAMLGAFRMQGAWRHAATASRLEHRQVAVQSSRLAVRARLRSTRKSATGDMAVSPRPAMFLRLRVQPPPGPSTHAPELRSLSGYSLAR